MAGMTEGERAAALALLLREQLGEGEERAPCPTVGEVEALRLGEGGEVRRYEDGRRRWVVVTGWPRD